MRRRAALQAVAAAAFVPLGKGTAVARDYGSAAEVLDEIDRLARDVEASLASIEAAVPGAREFAASVRADHLRHRTERDALRRRLGLSPARQPAPGAAATTLDALRAVQQELVHAHAEGLPALDGEAAVRALAGHMIDLSRHLTVIDLWIELHDVG